VIERERPLRTLSQTDNQAREQPETPGAFLEPFPQPSLGGLCSRVLVPGMGAQHH
jgi:hypothetical protein